MAELHPLEIETHYPTNVVRMPVIGVPDETRDETVKAFIILEEGMTSTLEEIREFCKERMSAPSYAGTSSERSIVALYECMSVRLISLEPTIIASKKRFGRNFSVGPGVVIEAEKVTIENNASIGVEDDEEAFRHPEGVRTKGIKSVISMLEFSHCYQSGVRHD